MEGKENNTTAEEINEIVSDIEENTHPADKPSPDIPKKKINPLFIILIVIIGILFFLIAGFFALNTYIRNKELKPNPQTSEIQPPTPTSIPISDDEMLQGLLEQTTDWQTYTNNKLGFSLKFPNNPLPNNDFILEEDNNHVVIAHTQSGGPYEYLTISFDEADFTNDSKYPKCSEDVTSTSSSPCVYSWPDEGSLAAYVPLPTTPDGQKLKSFGFACGNDCGYYIVQTTGSPKIELKHWAAGGGTDGSFAKILSTLKFTNNISVSPTSAVACTMDAKLCPDGSSVGRSGPKCEFAKCPGEN